MFSRYKPFLITFFLCLILFGSLLGVSVYLVRQQPAAEVAEPVMDVPVQPYQPQQKENLALALMCCNEREDLPSAYFFFKFDVVQGKLFLVEVPYNTLATVNTSTKTVEEFYQYGGMEYAAAAIGNLFLQERCYYLRTDVNTLQQAADALEGIAYTLKEPLQTKRYRLPAGEQQIDGSRLADLLLCDTFYEKTDLLAAFVTLRFNEQQVYRLDALYDPLFACDTDLTRVQLTHQNEAICYGLRLPLTAVVHPLLGETEHDRLQPNRKHLRMVCDEMAGQSSK